VKFWDASAIVPLLVAEPPTRALLSMVEQDPLVLVWWGTPLECTSAIAPRAGGRALRRRRGPGARPAPLDGRDRQEVLPTDAVRAAAQRLLRVHPLLEADALQLAAAIIGAEHEPASLDLVCLDDRLAEAAHREGFRVVRP